MLNKLIERRAFLKQAAQCALAGPIVSSMTRSGLAEQVKPSEKKAAMPHTAAAHAGPQVRLNVRDLGATGDGKTKDTLAIQQTIDRCSVLGGGEVLVPAGDYLTGALVLRNNVVLHVEEGASLLGSGD